MFYKPDGYNGRDNSGRPNSSRNNNTSNNNNPTGIAAAAAATNDTGIIEAARPGYHLYSQQANQQVMHEYNQQQRRQEAGVNKKPLSIQSLLNSNSSQQQHHHHPHQQQQQQPASSSISNSAHKTHSMDKPPTANATPLERPHGTYPYYPPSGSDRFARPTSSHAQHQQYQQQHHPIANPSLTPMPITDIQNSQQRPNTDVQRQQQQQQHRPVQHHPKSHQQGHFYNVGANQLAAPLPAVNFGSSSIPVPLLSAGHSGNPTYPPSAVRSLYSVQTRVDQPRISRTVASNQNSVAEDSRYRPYPEIYTSAQQQQQHQPQKLQQQQQQKHQYLGRTAHPSDGLETGRDNPTGVAFYLPASSLDDSKSQSKRVSEAIRRRRRTQACQYCHLKKIKCEGDGVRCINCIKNDVQCMWGMKRKRGPKPKPGVVAMNMSARGNKAFHEQQNNEQGQGKQQQGHEQDQERPAAAARLSKMPIEMILRESEEPISKHSGFEIPMFSASRPFERHLGEATAEAGGNGNQAYDDDDDDDDANNVDMAGMTPSSDANEGLHVPQMDKEMEEFFSDRVDIETRDAVRYYFDYFYPLCPMFHPSMFIRRVVRGEVDPILIDAMKAASARIITKKTGRFVDGEALARSVKQRILVQLEQPTADLVRVLVIMTLLSGSQGEYMSYNSLICLAASLVVRLGWHKLDLYKRQPPTSWDDWVHLEIKRRVFWLVYQTDSYQALLTGRPMSIAEDSVYVSAPCSDYEWDVVMYPGTHMAPTKGTPDGRHQQIHHQPQPQSQYGPAFKDKLPQIGKQRQRSSRSSSGSTHSLVQSLRVDQDVIVATGAFSFSFMALCELTAIIARINMFLCDAKTSRPSLLLPKPLSAHNNVASASRAMHSLATGAREGPFPAVDFMDSASGSGDLVCPIVRTVNLLSEYPTYVELDERMEEWKRNLLMPEDLRDDATKAADISYFGNADHRRFMMRVRYFCLHCYYVPIAICLHQSNRPSFFTEYEQPFEMRLRRQYGRFGDDSDYNSPTPEAEPALPIPEDKEAAESEIALREVLNMAFASTWNEGILAYDVEAGSWGICVRAAHGLSEHLERNSDFPLERFDQIIPFCIFMSVSILIRNVRICNRQLAAGEDNASDKPVENLRQQLANAGGPEAVGVERALCVKHIRHQWETLQSLGSIWDVAGMQQLLKSMQIDEVANTADMFSGMAL